MKDVASIHFHKQEESLKPNDTNEDMNVIKKIFGKHSIKTLS